MQLDAEVVILLQGDEPMTNPRMIDQSIAPMRTNPEVQCVNLIKRIESEEEFLDPNTIKVVLDVNNNALYFSREPIPTTRQGGYEKINPFKQVCIIPFRRDFLLAYAEMEPTPLEVAESIDMMRILEHGFQVKLVETEFNVHAVDTPADLTYVERLLAEDPLTQTYVAGRQIGK